MNSFRVFRPKEETELIRKGGHRRTYSDESPALPVKQRKESTPNPHILNLFGSPEDYSQHQPQEHQMMSESDYPMQNMLFRTILESPVKKFASRSVQNLDDPRAQYPENLMRSTEEHSEGDLRFKMD